MRLIVLILVLVCGVATAGPSAKTHYQRGKHLADKGRYREALVELSAGYEKSGKPLFLFNMAEVARALGDAEQALSLYERYVAAEPTGAFADTARMRIIELTPPAPPPVEATPAPAAPPPVLIPRAPEPEAPVTAVAAMQVPAPKREGSHFRRNALLVGLGVAVVAGSVAIYASTRGPDCGTGCIDLR